MTRCNMFYDNNENDNDIERHSSWFCIRLMEAQTDQTDILLWIGVDRKSKDITA